MEQKTKVVAYVRISSMRQIDNESPATQREAIQRFADQNGYEIVKWFEDIAKSGKDADRDGLQNLLRYCLTQKGSVSTSPFNEHLVSFLEPGGVSRWAHS